MKHSTSRERALRPNVQGSDCPKGQFQRAGEEKSCKGGEQQEEPLLSESNCSQCCRTSSGCCCTRASSGQANGIICSGVYEVTGRVRCVIWCNFPESLLQATPFCQQLSGTPTACFFVVRLNDNAQGFGFTCVVDTLELYQFGITAPWECSQQIQYVGDASRHASAKVLPGFAKDDDHTSCHIFA